MANKKMTFAIFVTNRGFMPGELIHGAREDMKKVIKDAGYDYIILDEKLTRYGGIETRDEGILYAQWLKKNEGKYDGVILSMPIFADENGAAWALKDCKKPILLQAYPDEIGKMDFKYRRDAYCGKFSVTDVFDQYGIPYSLTKSWVVDPCTDEFKQDLHDFAATCRVVNKMRDCNIGAIGARTTAFKTVRFDEVACQKYGINIESFDLSELVFEVGKLKDTDKAVVAKIAKLEKYTNFTKVPKKNKYTLAKIGVVVDKYIEDYHLDAISLRCWNEMETILRVCPCVLLSELNDRGIVASCEMDVESCLAMFAMRLASDGPAACLDWNNNYGTDPDKVVLFHCGPVAQKLMAKKGTVLEHKMFAKGDPGSGWGTNEGRIDAFPCTISNCKIRDGKIHLYVSEAEMTDDEIEDGYFGVAGVCQIPNLQCKLEKLARNGFKHHTAIAKGHMKKVLTDAFKYYLGYEVIDID